MVAYTIVVVQNIQALKFDQMQVALQTVHNKASIEMPLTAQCLMNAHFNLALLTDEIPSQTNAQEPEGATADARPSTSASEEMACKTSYKCQRNVHAPKPTTQPTRAVSPTRRDGYKPVCGIPVGYESDDTWDGTSDFGEYPCPTTNDISTFVAYRRWPRCPQRGRGQSHGQTNNIVVRGGKCAPSEAMGFNNHMADETRSQQALRARAYRKWQRRYQVP